MDKNEQLDTVLSMLENAYSGAKACDDVEMMTRLSRAIVMFSMDPEKGIKDYAYDVIRNINPHLQNDDPSGALLEVHGTPSVIVLVDEFIDELEFAICDEYNTLSENEIDSLNSIIDSRRDTL